MVKSAGAAAGSALTGAQGGSIMDAAGDVGGLAGKMNSAGAGVVNEMMGFAATKARHR